MKGTRDFSPASTQIPGAVFIDDDSGPPKSKNALKKERKKEREKLQKQMAKMDISKVEKPVAVAKTKPERENPKPKNSYSESNCNGLISVDLDSSNDASSWQTVSKGKSVAKTEVEKFQYLKNVVVAPVAPKPVKTKKKNGGANAVMAPEPEPEVGQDMTEETMKRVRGLKKKLTQIEKLEERKAKGEKLSDREIVKLGTKDSILAELCEYE